MNEEIKKYLKRLASEIRVGCCYIYAQKWGDAPYRFYYSAFGTKAMHKCVAEMRNRGFTVDIWRPKNA